MRLIRAAAALLMVLGAGMAGTLTGTAPAQAGGWATTVLDPVPDRFEPGKSYTLGFWVLQHGAYPYSGTLGPVGLELVGPNGARTTFPGTALPEPAHFATSIFLPTAGNYTLVGLQGPFQAYRVGTITVPGGLAALPVPVPRPIRTDDLPWKDIRPPDMPVDAKREPYEDTAALPAQPPSTPATADGVTTTAARSSSQSMRPTTTVLAAVAATALVLGLLLYRRRGPRRGGDRSG